MAIYIIGLLENGSEKLVRLYNDKKNQYRDMREKDVLFMLDEESLRIRNADIKNNKLVGTTGSLDKIKNKNVYIALGYISDTENKPVAYKFVDSNGKVYIVEVHDCIGFFEKNIVQNASFVDNKFVRGINWELPCVEERKKTPKNIKTITGLGSHLYITCKQDEIILYWDAIDSDTPLSRIGGELILPWNNFGLMLHSSHYDDLLEILADKVESVSVNPDGYGYRCVEFSYLHKSVSKDIEYVKQLSEKLGLHLSIYVTNDVMLDYSSFPDKYNDAHILMSRWGFTLVNDKGKLSWRDKKDYNYRSDSDYLSVWNDYLGYLYQKYLKKVQSICGIPIKLKRKYSSKDNESPTNVELTLKVSDNCVIFQPKTSSPKTTEVKVRKDTMLLNILPDNNYYSFNRKKKEFDVGVGFSNFLYVNEGIYDNVLLTLIKNRENCQFKEINFNNDAGFGKVSCMSSLSKTVKLFNLFSDKKRYVDYTKMLNPFENYLKSIPNGDTCLFDDNILYTICEYCLGFKDGILDKEGLPMFLSWHIKDIKTFEDAKLFMDMTNSCDLSLLYIMGYYQYHSASESLRRYFSQGVKIKECNIDDLDIKKIRDNYEYEYEYDYEDEDEDEDEDEEEYNMYNNIKLDKDYLKSHKFSHTINDEILWFTIKKK